jgi:hypothetical protein
MLVAAIFCGDIACSVASFLAARDISALSRSSRGCLEGSSKLWLILGTRDFKELGCASMRRSSASTVVSRPLMLLTGLVNFERDEGVSSDIAADPHCCSLLQADRINCWRWRDRYREFVDKMTFTVQEPTIFADSESENEGNSVTQCAWQSRSWEDLLCNVRHTGAGLVVTRTPFAEDSPGRTRISLSMNFAFTGTSTHYIEFSSTDVDCIDADGGADQMPGAAAHAVQFGLVCMVHGTEHRTFLFCPADGRMGIEGYGVRKGATTYKQVMPPLDNKRPLPDESIRPLHSSAPHMWQARTGLLVRNGCITLIRQHRDPLRPERGAVQETSILCSGFKGMLFPTVRLPYAQCGVGVGVQVGVQGPQQEEQGGIQREVQAHVHIRVGGLHSFGAERELREYMSGS